MPPVFNNCLPSDWARAGDMDSTGGPLHEMSTKKENPKWCQNPQFFVELQNTVAVDDVHMKIVVRRTDKGAAASKSVGGDSSKPVDAMVGVVICKADIEEEGNVKSGRKKGPKQNAMGEVIFL